MWHSAQGQQYIHHDCIAFWKNSSIAGHVVGKSAAPVLILSQEPSK